MGEQNAIDKVEAEIAALNVKLEKLEARIEDAIAAGDKEEVAALREDKRQLRRKEEQLREDKRQLRDKELALLQRQPGALGTFTALAPPLCRLIVCTLTGTRLVQLRRSLLCPLTACCGNSLSGLCASRFAPCSPSLTKRAASAGGDWIRGEKATALMWSRLRSKPRC